jgi:hypothetical protein
MVYRARSIKRQRRTKAEIEEIKSAIYSVVANDLPMTVRQVFYRLVAGGVIGKTESEYNTTVVRLLTQMRLEGEIPFNWIADNTRWMRKPESHSSLQSMLDITASAYRRALWDDQDEYVEIWLEKDALSGVIYRVTAEWDVPLMVTRGYPSISFLHNAAIAIEGEEKSTFIYYLGDWDPSGLDIERNIKDRLNEFADADIEFTRIAVTPEQVERWSLPTRPTKRTDTRAKYFKGDSVEVDAIPPNQLRSLVAKCIERHVDEDQLEKTRIAERSERQLLESWDEVLGDLHDGGGAA